jgi:hypothetical protein
MSTAERAQSQVPPGIARTCCHFHADYLAY